MKFPYPSVIPFQPDHGFDVSAKTPLRHLHYHGGESPSFAALPIYEHSRYLLSNRSGGTLVFCRDYVQFSSRGDRCASMCVSMKMLLRGVRTPVVFMCVGADRGTPILAEEWKMLGVPSRRLSRHLSPLSSSSHPRCPPP